VRIRCAVTQWLAIVINTCVKEICNGARKIIWCRTRRGYAVVKNYLTFIIGIPLWIVIDYKSSRVAGLQIDDMIGATVDVLRDAIRILYLDDKASCGQARVSPIVF
jgi:hypothetical protein